MSNPQRLMEIMSERLDRYCDPLNPTWLAMAEFVLSQSDAFTTGYAEALKECTRAIYFNENYAEEPGEYELGYYFAWLVILGLDTTGLGRE